MFQAKRFCCPAAINTLADRIEHKGITPGQRINEMLKQDDETYPADEALRRFVTAVKAALNTKLKPLKSMTSERRSGAIEETAQEAYRGRLGRFLRQRMNRFARNLKSGLVRLPVHQPLASAP